MTSQLCVVTLSETHIANLSSKDELVLALPARTTGSLLTPLVLLTWDGGEIIINRPTLFISSKEDKVVIKNKSHWNIEKLTLSTVVEMLAIADLALGEKRGCNFKNEEQMVVVKNQIQEQRRIEQVMLYSVKKNISLKTLIINLLLCSPPEFHRWCSTLRKSEAYGMLHFILSQIQLSKNINMNKLCMRYGVSASYFRRIYKEIFKTTAKKKIMAVRMADAILRLIESDSSILSIGLDAGYYSASHFTSDLKNKLGLTPSEIRHLGKVFDEKFA